MTFVVAMISVLLAAAEAQVLLDSPNCDPVSVPGSYVIANTNGGQVRGLQLKTVRSGTSYTSFRGIPFAAPPVGELRFKAPVDPEPWPGIRDAVQVGPSCLQFKPNSSLNSNESEDCLYVNVYVPGDFGSNVSSPKAVMVFIYGGAYLTGTSDTKVYGPEFFMKEDVILVSFNYRLGALGFLSLQNKDIPGNAGLKDQLKALEWVRDNIAYFGGSPVNVTLFGESAGSASVSYHLLSPRSQGLFRNAIMESGSALNQWAFINPDDVLDNAKALAKKLDCSESDLYRCLMTADPLEITSKEEVITLEAALDFSIFSFLPTVEPDVQDAFLTEHPRKLFEQGKFNKDVTVILGINSAEGLLVRPVLDKLDPLSIAVTVIGLDLSIFAPLDLGIRHHPLAATLLNKAINDFYFSGLGLNFITRDRIYNLLTVVQFALQIELTLSHVARHSHKPVYSYQFSFVGKYNLLKTQLGLDAPIVKIPLGASHADELGYMFNRCDMSGVYNSSDPDAPPEVTIDRLTGLWANLAKYGSPTAKRDRHINLEWSPYTLRNPVYLDIGNDLALETRLRQPDMKFWNNFYQLLQGKRPFPE